MRVLVTTTGTVVTHALADDLLLLDERTSRRRHFIYCTFKELVQEFDADGTIESRGVGCGAKVRCPGLIDAHTHLIWAGDRSDEVGKRLSGMS